MARWITSDYLEKVLIDKGLTAGEARAFSKQEWVLDLAEKAAWGNLPKDAPKFTPETLQQYRQKAKDAGVPLIDYVQQQFAPETVKAAPTPAATPPADVPQPAAPPTLAAPAPPQTTAPQPQPDAPAAAPQNQLYHKPYTLTPADTSDAVVNKIYNESDKKGPASYGPIIGTGFNRLESEGRGPSSTLKEVFFSMGHDGKHQQYTAPTTPAPPEAAAQIREEINRQAPGTVPNPAGNSTDYLYSGASKSWIKEHNAQQIGGNWYVPKGTKVGGYADASPVDITQTQVATADIAPPPAAPTLGAPAAPTTAVNKYEQPRTPIEGQPNVTYSNEKATRNYPIDPLLMSQMNKTAGNLGLEANVFSGGQKEPFRKPGGGMTSHRHDIGNLGYSNLLDPGTSPDTGGAGDVFLYDKNDGHLLTDDNPEDQARMADFTAGMVSEGERGVGAAHDYMGPEGIHVGGGNSGVWGNKKTGSPPAPWIVAARERGLNAPPIPSRNPARAGEPQPEMAEAPAASPPPQTENWAPPPSQVGRPEDFGQPSQPSQPSQDLSTDWTPPQFGAGDFGPPTPTPPMVAGGVGYDALPPSADPSMMQRPLEPQLGPLAPPVLGAPVLGSMSGALASSEDALGPLLDPSMPLPSRAPTPPIVGMPMPLQSMVQAPLEPQLPTSPMQIPTRSTYSSNMSPINQPPMNPFDPAAAPPLGAPSYDMANTFSPATPQYDMANKFSPIPPTQNPYNMANQFSPAMPQYDMASQFSPYPQTAPTAPPPTPFSNDPMAGGPPGTTRSVTEPNTYLPSTAQSGMMEPFTPLTAPTLGGAPVAPSMGGFAVADNSGFPDQSSVMGPNVTSPNIMESPFQYAPPFPSVLNDPNAANLMAPTLGAPTMPGSGPPMLNGLGYDPTQLGTANTAGMPTFGSIGHIGMPSDSLGAVPPMSSYAMPSAFGMGAASPLGGIAIGQYAGGTSMPTSMAEGLSSGAQAYTGSGFNPATLAGTGIGGTDLSSGALGAVGPSGSAGVASSGGETSGGGGGPVGSSGTSHAIAIMQKQAAEHAAKMASEVAARQAANAQFQAKQNSYQAQSSANISTGLARQRAMEQGMGLFDVNKYYGMNIGFGGNRF